MQDESDSAGAETSSGPGPAGAVIFAFPPRPGRAPTESQAGTRTGVVDPLLRLERALAEQREAIQAWRNANIALAASVSDLTTSLATLETRLAHVASYTANTGLDSCETD